MSERELDVARAVARGLGNQEIATELFISLSTVKTHLTSIQTKLQLRNRVEIAIWVIEHDPRPPPLTLSSPDNPRSTRPKASANGTATRTFDVQSAGWMACRGLEWRTHCRRHRCPSSGGGEPVRRRTGQDRSRNSGQGAQESTGWRTNTRGQSAELLHGQRQCADSVDRRNHDRPGCEQRNSTSVTPPASRRPTGGVRRVVRVRQCADHLPLLARRHEAVDEQQEIRQTSTTDSPFAALTTLEHPRWDRPQQKPWQAQSHPLEGGA